MSRHPSFRSADPDVNLQLSPHPSIKGKFAASAWYTETLGIPVTVNAIERYTVSGELASFMIGGARWYATQDLADWIMSRRQSASAAEGSAVSA